MATRTDTIATPNPPAPYNLQYIWAVSLRRLAPRGLALCLLALVSLARAGDSLENESVTARFGLTGPTELKDRSAAHDTVEPEYTQKLLTQERPLVIRRLMDTPLRDTSICRGPDGTWYLTGTVEPFWAYNEGIKLWRSKDLDELGAAGLCLEIRRQPLAQAVPRKEEAALGAGDPLSQRHVLADLQHPGLGWHRQDLRLRAAQEHDRQGRRPLRRTCSRTSASATRSTPRCSRTTTGRSISSGTAARSRG